LDERFVAVNVGASKSTRFFGWFLDANFGAAAITPVDQL
jgi:hypothetical protein